MEGGERKPFKGHSTTGIGYKKKGKKIKLIVLDGVKRTKKPQYIPYRGFKQEELIFPHNLSSFQPLHMKDFEEAEVEIEIGEMLKDDITPYVWIAKFKSNNKVGIELYGGKSRYIDIKGASYHPYWPFIKEEELLQKRINPYKSSFLHRQPEEGQCVSTYYFIDDNGHLLKSQHTMTIGVIDGDWEIREYCTNDSRHEVPYTVTFYPDGIVVFHFGHNKPRYKLNIKRKKIIISNAPGWEHYSEEIDSYSAGGVTTYTGKVNKKVTKMQGTWVNPRNPDNPKAIIYSGTWSAIRKKEENIENKTPN